MRWIELSITAHPEAVEPVSEALATIAANGVALDAPYVLEDEGQRWRPIPDAPVTVRAYLPDDDQADAALTRLRATLWHLGQIGAGYVGELTTRTVDEADWAEAWKAGYAPTRVGRHLIIAPTWRLAEAESAPADVVVALDPGMAFGTGTHPTTRLCLEALEATVRPGDRVLDVGCGSGILLIAALKLGADAGVGIDLSAEAVTATRENARLNGVEDRCTILHGTLDLGEAGQPLAIPPPPAPGEDPLLALGHVRAIDPAPIVVANILASVIGWLAPTLLAATAPGGTLIASGILAERRAEAEGPLLAAGLRDVRVLQEGDWLALIGRRAE